MSLIPLKGIGREPANPPPGILIFKSQIFFRFKICQILFGPVSTVIPREYVVARQTDNQLLILSIPIATTKWSNASDCCLSYACQSPRSLGSYCQLKHDKSSSIPIHHQPASQEAALLSHVYPICQPKDRALPIRVSIDQECYLLGDKACGNLSNLIVELEYYSECHMALLPLTNNR